MQEQKNFGEISVTTEHIFPIIKRWLYSDKDIFLRELVSNASDAITKLKRLVSLSESSAACEGAIEVVLDEAAGTLTVRDDGIGMTADEVERYLNQIALSGALEFIERYEGTEGADGIIGHFGLGFYSAFMVASQVEVFTKSHTDAPAVHWTCSDAGAYEMAFCEKAHVGTEVVLHITEEEKTYLQDATVRSVLEKYCAFFAYPITLNAVGKEADATPINDPSPIWQKSAQDVTDEEYRSFYHKLFGYASEPLFWIHLNADYPLNFKGVLYFPRLNHQFQSMEGEVKLFYNRVFVADNISEVIPEYLLCLKGVLDCPELPLNVSRSFLQSSPYVAKLSAHISKKVSDKLSELFANEREAYEGFSQDLKPFLEYGAMRDEKFAARIAPIVMYPADDGSFVTLSEYVGEGEDKTVYYTTDPVRQAQYIALFQKEGKRVITLDTVLDSQYISRLENKEEGYRFVRVDSATDALSESEGEDEVLKQLFSMALGEKIDVKFVNLKDAETPALLTTEEESRRFADMMRAYQSRGMAEGLPLDTKEVLTVNLSCPVCVRLKEADASRRNVLARQIYYSALLASRAPTEEELKAFLENNYKLLEL